MAKKTVEFDLHLSPDEALDLCRAVARERRWEIERVVSRQFVASTHLRTSLFKVTVAVNVEPVDSGTHVTLTGLYFLGLGPGPHSEAAYEWRDTILYEASRRRKELG